MNVTVDPAQVGLVPEVKAIETAGTSDEFTTIVIGVLVAVVGLAHDEFEVKMHVTTCPFVNVEDVKVAEFVPAFVPFTCH